MRTRALFSLLLLFAVTAGCSSKDSGSSDASAGSKPKYAYVTNCIAEFWTIAECGALQAGKDLQADVTVIMPTDMTDQTRKIEDMLMRGCDGIAISPIDSVNQIDVINKSGQVTNMITQDSDAPNSERLMYLGMDNYLAGRMCGDLVRAAIPDGGKVMIFIGRIDQDNAKRRRQGCIDTILGRDADSTRFDPPGEVLTSDDGKFTVLGTLTDQTDQAKGKANVEDTLTAHPDIAAMVGLFVYNPPLILEALDRASKLNKVAVIGFDEAEVTLQGIKDGLVFGTVVQDPYKYGYESIRILNELNKGNTSVIPENKFINIPARTITSDNVEEFWQDLKKKTGK